MLLRPPQNGRSWLLIAIAVLVGTVILYSGYRNADRIPYPGRGQAQKSQTMIAHLQSEIADLKQHQPSQPIPADDKWSFDVHRDRHNHGLTDQQCSLAFPGLYAEIDRAVEHRKKTKPIREEDIKFYDSKEGEPSHTQHHALVYDGQLRILGHHPGVVDRSRGYGVLASLHRAITSMPDPTSLPNVEFVLDVEDLHFEGPDPDRVAVAFLRRADGDHNTWVIPDFNGWSFPADTIGSYFQFLKDVETIETPFAEKEDKLAWRGALEVAEELRGKFLKETEGKSWSDVELLDWKEGTNLMNMHEFCRYKYVAHTEGNSWSGRLRFLQNCHSVTIIHTLRFIAHYYPLLQPSGPSQNYIPVALDFADLDAQMNHYLANPLEAERIANESARVFRDRYLTPAAESCYLRRFLQGYHQSQGFEPRLWTDGRVGEEGAKRQRGHSYEREANRPFVHG